MRCRLGFHDWRGLKLAALAAIVLLVARVRRPRLRVLAVLDLERLLQMNAPDEPQPRRRRRHEYPPHLFVPVSRRTLHLRRLRDAPVLRNSLTYHTEDPRDATIATLRAALDGLVEAAEAMADAYRDIEGDVINGRTDLAWDHLCEAIASAKETP